MFIKTEMQRNGIVSSAINITVSIYLLCMQFFLITLFDSVFWTYLSTLIVKLDNKDNFTLSLEEGIYICNTSNIYLWVIYELGHCKQFLILLLRGIFCTFTLEEVYIICKKK